MATLTPSSPSPLPPTYPSLDRTTSTTSTADTTNIESSEEIHMVAREISAEEVAAIRNGLKVLHQSKSMQGLKPAQPIKEVKRSGLRNRAFSASETNNVVMPRPAPPKARPIPQAPPLAARNSRNDVPKSGGFSAFIRKLTGRSTSPPKSKIAVKEVPIPIPESKIVQTAPTPPKPIAISRTASTSSAPDGPTPKPSLANINVNVARDRFAPASAPAAPQPGAILAGPIPPCPPRRDVEELMVVQEVDPCEVPLPLSRPASPILGPVVTSRAEHVDEVTSLSRSSSMSNVSQRDSPMKRTKPSGNLMAEDNDDAREELAEDAEEGSEEEDVVRELQPIRIPSNSSRHYNNGQPHTPSSIASGIEEIVTPTSMTGSSPNGGYTGMRLAGSSPPHKAPVGTGMSSDLGRKGSKWRKSMMGLSDTLNGKSIGRKQSQATRAPIRAPPTSYDAYQAHQQRIANNRVSCAPTIHSQASIAAEAREIRDKEESDLTETFFLS